jgi:hypothetical protein
MKTSWRGAHHVSYARSASISFGSIFGYVRYASGALSVVAFGFTQN